MRVEELMTRNVVTVPEHLAADDAYARMRAHRIHHLVVLDDRKRVVGLVSDRDLGGTRGDRLRDGQLVGEFMTREIASARRDDTVRSVANKLRGRAIGCLPVFDGERLVGIVTVTDLLDMIGRGMAREAPRSDRRRVNEPRKRNPRPTRRG